MNHLFFIICLLFVKYSFACDCESKPEIDIRDLNDSPIVFSATLTQFENKEGVTNLTFSISKVYKGKLGKKPIRFSIAKEEVHDDVLHHIDTIFTGQKWIVFSTYFKKNDDLKLKLKQSNHTDFKNKEDLILKLKQSNHTDYCMLSKPITFEDPYLAFIEKVFQNRKSTNKIYFADSVAFAVGSLKNNFPTGIWKYYASKNLDHYWEGTYVRGRRDGIWIEKAVNYKEELVVICEKTYQSGILKEHIKYNYIGDKKMHETQGEKVKKRIIYSNNAVYSIWMHDIISNTTTIEYYKKDKLIDKKTRSGNFF